MRIPAAWQLVLGAALVCGCVPPPEAASLAEGTLESGDWDTLLIAQVPTGPFLAGSHRRLHPDERFPPGSRIVLLSRGSSSGSLRSLSAGLTAAGAPDLSPTATSAVFTGRRPGESRWSIHEVALPRGRPHRVIDTDLDCIDPAYLAGNRLVFSCAGEAEGWQTRRWSLYTAAAQRNQLTRITFGPGSAFDPTPLQDGRILFSMWQGPGTGRSAGGTALFTINPDGTMLEPFTGSHTAPIWKVRARQTLDGGVVFLSAGDEAAPDPAGPSSTVLERVEMRRPLATRHPLQLVPSPLAAEPVPGGGLLLTARGLANKPLPVAAVYIWQPAHPARADLLFADHAWHQVEALPVVAWPAPRGRPSAVAPGSRTGKLVCYDAGRSDQAAVQDDGATPPRTGLLEMMPGSDPAAAVTLGGFTLAGDGSFFLEVPADRPLRLTSMDAGGQIIDISDWFWVRPGEVRTCFGCHEDRESAPINRPVEAIAGDPVLLEGITPGGGP